MASRGHLPLAAALGLLLAACGGGLSVAVGDFDDDHPFFGDAARPSGRSATLTVSAATDVAVDGVYRATDLRLTPVRRTATQPARCMFAFQHLLQDAAAGGRSMRGDLRYAADTGEVLVTSVLIEGFEYRADGGAVLDRARNEVRYANVPFRSTRDPDRSLALSGSIPMVPDRPAGC